MLNPRHLCLKPLRRKLDEGERCVCVVQAREKRAQCHSDQECADEEKRLLVAAVKRSARYVPRKNVLARHLFHTEIDIVALNLREGACWTIGGNMLFLFWS
jgi:hypothetical protein